MIDFLIGLLVLAAIFCFVMAWLSLLRGVLPKQQNDYDKGHEAYRRNRPYQPHASPLWQTGYFDAEQGIHREKT